MQAARCTFPMCSRITRGTPHPFHALLQDDVYQRARRLLEKWFAEDGDEVHIAGPATNENNQFVFGAPHTPGQTGFHF